MLRRPLPVLAVTAVAAVVGGCARTATPDEFRREAERTLLATAQGNGVVLNSVSCENPGQTEIGTVFQCDALDEGGAEFRFNVRIDTPKKLTIIPA